MNKHKINLKNIQSGFSLMEMMVVLLIVAIIAAATAPMVTKKMARNVGSGDSPWVFTGLNNNIAYNMSGADASAIIGASSYSHGDNQPSHPRLVLAADGANRPALVFAGADGAYGGQINMDLGHSIVTMNDSLDFVYTYRCDEKEFVLDTREMRKIIGDVPFSTPEVSDFIRSYLDENKQCVDSKE